MLWDERKCRWECNCKLHIKLQAQAKILGEALPATTVGTLGLPSHIWGQWASCGLQHKRWNLGRLLSIEYAGTSFYYRRADLKDRYFKAPLFYCKNSFVLPSGDMCFIPTQETSCVIELCITPILSFKKSNILWTVFLSFCLL